MGQTVVRGRGSMAGCAVVNARGSGTGQGAATHVVFLLGRGALRLALLPDGRECVDRLVVRLRVAWRAGHSFPARCGRIGGSSDRRDGGQGRGANGGHRKERRVGERRCRVERGCRGVQAGAVAPRTMAAAFGDRAVRRTQMRAPQSSGSDCLRRHSLRKAYATRRSAPWRRPLLLSGARNRDRRSFYFTGGSRPPLVLFHDPA